MSLTQNAGVVRTRQAGAADASAISSLYLKTYTPEGGGNPLDNYPFPQIMEVDSLARLLTKKEIVWVVAETDDGTIVGSAAALLNILSEVDKVAEIFGVAVEQSSRTRGVGSLILKRLVREVRGSAKLILCEARTAEAGGWKVARNSGFVPIGFEPYAHAMPVGFESMILTAI